MMSMLQCMYEDKPSLKRDQIIKKVIMRMVDQVQQQHFYDIKEFNEIKIFCWKYGFTFIYKL